MAKMSIETIIELTFIDIFLMVKINELEKHLLLQ
jgi:hypothetical protein